MKEYRNLLIALGVMALLTPVGLYLPRILQAGGAWGEWGINEVRKMVGYAPAGMEKTADAWKAPIPDYAPPGGGDASSPAQGLYYLISAFLGIIACGGAAYLLARRLIGRGRPPTNEKS
jgi:hypothetical protein